MLNYYTYIMAGIQKPRVLISEQNIKKNIKDLAHKITHDYQDKNPLILGVLKGSFIFMADLIRELDFDLQIEFIRLSSYGSLMESPGVVNCDEDISDLVNGRHVLIIEDIIDTGTTLSFLIEQFQAKNPLSVRLCALASKPSRRLIKVEIDYLAFEIPDKFIVGYGLDHDEKYRNLPYIGVIDPKD